MPEKKRPIARILLAGAESEESARNRYRSGRKIGIERNNGGIKKFGTILSYAKDLPDRLGTWKDSVFLKA